MIYLDNSATTKPHPEVLEAYHKVAEHYFGNPSSIHHFGGESERLLTHSKKQAANILNVLPEEIVFTSGGTEGNNMAIKGIAFAHQNRGKHIITSQVEHPSVLEACHALESLGFDITYLPVSKEGIVNVDDLRNSITPETILVSIMSVNNELGTIQPISEIGTIVKKHPKIFFHVDHVQGLGKIALDFKAAGVDLCTVSGHKIHGVKGTGALFIRKGTTLFPLQHGGGQEGTFRSGTENLAGIVAFTKALRLIKEAQDENQVRLLKLNKMLREHLREIPQVIINSPAGTVPHILNFSVPGYKPEVIIHSLGEKEIYISTKSACSSKRSDESAVLAACQLGEARATSALRVSLSYGTTEEDIEIFINVLRRIVNELHEVMG
ncbi:cysteine desulfurase family protein [Thalassobacillus pellis]|uniref:cysteine desulfurase family protein n=1 Tax=Thalassobacillus pellis TaxID=748008 RepID=UPI0019617C2B|nr:cysteine desulfurase family protein [Thalassobacillus pellis]MBM7554948.1 cysteine desulfurase [Thalassobacillus pellis]